MTRPASRLQRLVQIKRYYHRLLRKINVMLAPAIQAINTLDADDVRLSLLSW
jgi:hypothetical protein